MSKLIGMPFYWPSEELPDKTMWLDGSLVAIDDYPELFAVFGRRYTAPEAEPEKFALPDTRGLHFVGVDDGAGRNITIKLPRVDGETDVVGATQADWLAAHPHAIGFHRNAGTNTTQGFGQPNTGSGVGTTSATGGTETTVPNIGLACICYYTT